MKNICVTAIACVFTSCAQTPKTQAVSPASEPDGQISFIPWGVTPERGKVSVEEANRRNADIFRRQNAAYVVDSFPVEPFSKATFSGVRRRQTLLRADGLQVDISLGVRIHSAPEGTNGYRTSSRYTLKTITGRTLVSAESILDYDPEDDHDSEISVFTDIDRRTVLIMEYRAGTGPRCILFNASLSKASVRYVDIPLRVEASQSPMHVSLPNIIGIKAGRVYLQEDGRIYAFPLDGLTDVTSLEFSLG